MAVLLRGMIRLSVSSSGRSNTIDRMRSLSKLNVPSHVNAARRTRSFWSSSSAQLEYDDDDLCEWGATKNDDVIRDLFMSYARIDPKSSEPCLHVSDLRELLWSIGERPSDIRLQQIIDVVDADQSGTVELDEFLVGCDEILAHDYGDVYSGFTDADDLIRTFRMLDRNGDGVVTVEEMTGLLSASGAGTHMTEEDARHLMSLADLNYDNTMDVTEFIRLVANPAAARYSWRLRSAFRAILVVGGPSSGKGLFCDRLVREAGIEHCSSGDVLREEVESGSPLGMEIEQTMKEGRLLPSSTVMALMKKRGAKFPGSFVALDGFPRSLENYNDFTTQVGPAEFAIYIDVPDDVMMDRMLKRAQESPGRVDDSVETARKRIDTFHKMGLPMLDCLTKNDIPIHTLDGTGTPDDVWDQFLGMNTPLAKTLTGASIF